MTQRHENIPLQLAEFNHIAERSFPLFSFWFVIENKTSNSISLIESPRSWRIIVETPGRLALHTFRNRRKKSFSFVRTKFNFYFGNLDNIHTFRFEKEARKIVQLSAILPIIPWTWRHLYSCADTLIHVSFKTFGDLGAPKTGADCRRLLRAAQRTFPRAELFLFRAGMRLCWCAARKELFHVCFPILRRSRCRFITRSPSAPPSVWLFL